MYMVHMNKRVQEEKNYYIFFHGIFFEIWSLKSTTNKTFLIPKQDYDIKFYITNKYGLRHHLNTY